MINMFYLLTMQGFTELRTESMCGKGSSTGKFICHLIVTHGKIIYGGTSLIEDDRSDTFLNLFFHFLPAAALCDDFSLVDSVET